MGINQYVFDKIENCWTWFCFLINVENCSHQKKVTSFKWCEWNLRGASNFSQKGLSSINKLCLVFTTFKLNAQSYLTLPIPIALRYTINWWMSYFPGCCCSWGTWSFQMKAFLRTFLTIVDEMPATLENEKKSYVLSFTA